MQIILFFRPSRFRLLLAWLTFLIAILVTGPTSAAQGISNPITPKQTVVLFDGKTKKDLSEFYTWLAIFGRHDPDKVFTVVDQVDGAPAIRASGQHWGGIVTKNNYTNYKLVVEFRWGLATWAPRANRTRDSGILLHGQGEDGNASKFFNSPWMSSVEYQIIEGGTGDVILVNGVERESEKPLVPKLWAKVAANGKNWDPAGKDTEFTRGRIDWQYRDIGWKDALGFRGAKDVEKAVGEWNRIEAICSEGDVDYFLNGVKILEGRRGSYTWGKLLFQSEGAEIFFRLIELHPLPN